MPPITRDVRGECMLTLFHMGLLGLGQFRKRVRKIDADEKKKGVQATHFHRHQAAPGRSCRGFETLRKCLRH